MPSAEQVADIGLAPIRPGGGRPTQKLWQRQQALQSKINRRAAAGKPSPKASKTLANVQAQLDQLKGPSYL